MNRIILLISLFVLPYSGNCQNYQSLFGQDSTTWTIVKEIIDGAATSRFKTFTGFDSTFNGQNYNVVSDEWQITGLIREDTVTGKTWYYSFSTQTERLIMDLSLQLNDTFKIYTYFMDSIPIAVDSVYFIGGLKHVRFNFNNFSGSSKMEFIEGIGPTAGITYQDETTAWINFSEQLLCKYTDSTQVYSNTDYSGSCFVFWAGIDDAFNDSKVVAYPNPLKKNETLYLKNVDEHIQQVQLFDMAGKKVLQPDANPFNLDLPAGAYFLKIIPLSEKPTTIKIILVD